MRQKNHERFWPTEGRAFIVSYMRVRPFMQHEEEQGLE
jgi:hypothetical protein